MAELYKQPEGFFEEEQEEQLSPEEIQNKKYDDILKAITEIKGHIESMPNYDTHFDELKQLFNKKEKPKYGHNDI